MPKTYPVLYIVQFLCENRHCLSAAAPNDREIPLTEVMRQVQKVMFHGKPPVCLLCGSTNLHFEAQRPLVPEMRALLARMAAIQAEQTESRERLRMAGVPFPLWPETLCWNFDALLDPSAPNISIGATPMPDGGKESAERGNP